MGILPGLIYLSPGFFVKLKYFQVSAMNSGDFVRDAYQNLNKSIDDLTCWLKNNPQAFIHKHLAE